MDALTYPAPVKRCKDKVTGKILNLYDLLAGKGYAGDSFFAMKINEELAEALAEKFSYFLTSYPPGAAEDCERRTQKEIVDIITVCHSWLHTVYGLTDEDISKLIEEANEKNRARGYL